MQEFTDIVGGGRLTNTNDSVQLRTVSRLKNKKKGVKINYI